MTNKEILQANLLDIIFENRNKEYGAYALRRGYNIRLLIAMSTAMSIVLLFIFTGMLKKDVPNSLPLSHVKEEMIIREIQIPKEKIKQPVQPEEIIKAKLVVKSTPKVAAVKFTSPPQIKTRVKEPMPAVEDLIGKVTATQNVIGESYDGIVKEVQQPVESNTEGNIAGVVQPEMPFTVQEREPEFPGGSEGLKRFMGRYLNTPEELEAGEKKVVKIRFKVDKDGTVNTFEIVTSGGSSFDNEVVKVCKKMPRWVPGIQNGINVPVNYVLPVTFIGVEE